MDNQHATVLQSQSEATETPQRRALNILEICEEIVAHVSSCEEMSHKHTLAQLARTSAAFHEPALNDLWRTLVDFTPVLRLLELVQSSKWIQKPEDTVSM